MSLSGIVMRAGAATGRAVYLMGMKSSTAAGSALAVTGRRGMTTFSDREKGEETVYMRREDKRLLEKILEKERAGASGEDSGRAQLMAILGSHKLPEDVIASLLKWKSS